MKTLEKIRSTMGDHWAIGIESPVLSVTIGDQISPDSLQSVPTPRDVGHKRETTMRIAILAAGALILAGCNTLEGIGKDIGATGNAIAGTARDVRTGKTPKDACKTAAGRPSDIDTCRKTARR
jgi:predicted small secreted protein